MELRDLRTNYDLSQKKAADIVGMPLRTYIRYEEDDNYGDSLKRKAIVEAINDCCEITEEKGILTVGQIKATVEELLNKEFKDKVEFCYLFGSYAKGYATEKSDVDLCISTELSGLEFAGLSERLRESLHKNIDLIRLSNLKDNIQLVNEIMKGGIKIFG